MRQIDTNQFLPRLIALLAPLENTADNLRPYALPGPISREPDLETQLVFQSVMFANTSVRVSESWLVHTIALWKEGRMTGVTPLIRLLLEYWGAVCVNNDILRQAIIKRDFDGAAPKSMRLTTGARSPVKLPWGGETNEKSIHVMDFVRRAGEEDKNAVGDYDFLCEACHPSFVQHFYFYIASKTYDDGSVPAENAMKHVESLLDQTAKACERAVLGISNQCAFTIELGGPVIRKFFAG